uniref:ABC transporter domain-containing protein n=1 Tax=Clastoptera arizonana TaxID=38151 RepID=A0A1B6C944_9HEMI
MTENEINSEPSDVSGKKYDALEVDPITATDSCQILESKQKLNNPVNITFHNISRKVRTLVKTGKGLRYKTDWKYILHNLSGQFLGGELTAVIGPSGAGKSSLLDIISGYTKDYEKGGYVNISCDHSQLSYNMYDNQLEPLLTVKESMICAANLKLGSSVSYNEKKSKIMGILSRLNLLNCKDKKTNQLSKGQYKLLSIALELISNPPAMFFDEPTSGLDCWSSKNIIDILKDLTRKGITIICTIHQPSASLFAKFDRVYVMAKGCCAYQGSAYGLIPFLASIDNINLICPSHYNPADYMIDACIGEYDNVLDTNSGTYKTMNVFDNLVKKIDNGKNWISESVTFVSSVDKSQKTAAQRIQINKIYDKNSEPSEVYTSSYKYPTTIFAQLCILLHRTYLKLQRDTFFTQLRIILHIIVGSFIGGLFCSIGRDAANVFDNLSLLFFSLMFLMFTALSSTMMSFPSEMPIVTREYFNKWYSLKSYYLALTMVDTPIQVICPVLILLYLDR